MHEMKDSGIEWIGAIPTTWHTQKMKYISNFIQNKYSSDYGLLPYIGLENIASWSGSFISTNSQYDREQSLICEPEDILFGKLRPYLAKVYMNDRLCCCSNEFAVIRVNGQNKRYMWYQLLSHGFIFEIDRSTYGTKMPRANAEFIRNVFVALPSEIEQQKIANYLDKMCAEIDAVLEKTRASIEEYKKLKQAVITQAVTKGIRGDRPMKDSGIEWIGDIPAEWSVVPFSKFARVSANLVNPSDYQDYLQVSPENIEKDSGKLLPCKTVSEVGVESWNHFFHKGQILYSKIRPKLNKVCIAPFDGLCSADMYPIDTDNISKFVVYTILSNDFNQQVAMITENRVKMPKINQKELSKIIVVLPADRMEQQEIVDYLDGECGKIDALIAKKQQYLTEIENYKKSLIYEYVTGKKEVKTSVLAD